MIHPRLPVSAIPQFAHLNLVSLNGVEIGHRSDAGLSLQHVSSSYDPIKPLLTVDKGLVACESSIAEAAKADVHLADVLEAVGSFALTPRGAAVVFLIAKLTAAAKLGVGVRDCWSEYIKFLPALSEMPLPVFWNEEERGLLRGSSLYVAVTAKLQSLEEEFEAFRTATSGLAWCNKTWWDEETLSFDDWKLADGWFRSRVVELPIEGPSMVPMIDLINHGQANTHYNVNGNGDVVLLQNDGVHLQEGEELIINYGREKSSAEMLFSYGFIEADQEFAHYLVLDFKCPADDPLKPVKEAAFKSAPIVRISEVNEATKDHGSTVVWTGPFVWLACINEEDGLSFRVLQETSGQQCLQVLWNENEVADLKQLVEWLQESSLFPLFQLRALALVQERVEEQLRALMECEAQVDSFQRKTSSGERAKALASRLRRLEFELLTKAIAAFEVQKQDLLNLDVVSDFLRRMQAEDNAEDYVADDGDDIDLA